MAHHLRLGLAMPRRSILVYTAQWSFRSFVPEATDDAGSLPGLGASLKAVLMTGDEIGASLRPP
jgi:hypothetical protein